ncbi:MAG: hypothetical protein A2534_02640 [Candidatus Magasanikbacteria bacterium RIFOXYD2_FULL_39_9]|uniref:Uncharacterized protein n=1 Tax=Candidatus Magasanikbacteria bacterium RIFOXYD1_FULL_40_23 TaxID=1798705 RepID=A0A1F6PB46_9BACT|nr:MAG: hypothetical protein A2534_02640 [Candidatus Magasanikbacteria bacterium RIFOXYD2_FULL_39_9]OGH93348.1 MAG: hypothetical protein A2563_01935 [Candidatus Magasanikbacteria bacterium RIFOXYD1_FULL_40_23]
MLFIKRNGTIISIEAMSDFCFSSIRLEYQHENLATEFEHTYSKNSQDCWIRIKKGVGLVFETSGLFTKSWHFITLRYVAGDWEKEIII